MPDFTLSEIDTFLAQVVAEHRTDIFGPQQIATFLAAPVAPPCPRVPWRGVTVCDHHADKLQMLADASGSIYIKPLPGCGSYQTTTAASAGTHALGGAIDLDFNGLTSDQRNTVIDLARDTTHQVAWRRDANSTWTNHAHMLDPSCPHLADIAAGQIWLFKEGYNGLVGNAADVGSRASVSVIWAAYLSRVADAIARAANTAATTAEDNDMTPEQAKQLANLTTAVNALTKAEADRYKSATDRHRYEVSLIKNIDLADAEAIADAIPDDIAKQVADLLAQRLAS